MGIRFKSSNYKPCWQFFSLFGERHKKSHTKVDEKAITVVLIVIGVTLHTFQFFAWMMQFLIDNTQKFMQNSAIKNFFRAHW